jgi:hypothetical protein
VLLKLAARPDARVSRPLLLVAILALGTSTTVPFCCARPVVYEVAIASVRFL